MVMKHEGRLAPAPYLQMAAFLREEILSGRIAPGRPVPSEKQLMLRHKVSRSVAKRAVDVLKSDQLVEGRQGAGVFVRASRRIIREPGWPTPLTRPGDGSELYWPQSLPGAWHVDPWEYLSEEVRADAEVARRLGIGAGRPVLRSVSRYTTGGTAPVLLLVTSWQLVTTRPMRQPDELCEQIIVRAATPDEIARLELPSRGLVVAIIRTHTARGVPVETADVVMPSDQCELVYRLPIVARTTSAVTAANAPNGVIRRGEPVG